MTDWSGPSESHRRRTYEASEVEAFVEHVTTRVAELERQMALLNKVDSAGVDDRLRPAGEADRQWRARQAEAEHQARARLAEADRYFAERLIDADLQAQAILEQAHSEGRALVAAVRRSLEELIRLTDEDALAAPDEAHHRILAILDQKLSQPDGRQ